MLNLIQTQDSPAIIQIQVLKGFMGNERSLFLSWCLLYFNEYSIRRVREVTLGIIDWDMEQVRGQRSVLVVQNHWRTRCDMDICQ